MQQSSVIMNLWPYLLALETDERRFNFVQKVYNREFDLETLKIGNEICIRAPPGSEAKYYEFEVKYFGGALRKGVGSYISLQLKNDNVAFTGELKSLSQYYQFSGKGIVVPADWIMLNLYKKEACQSESLINMFPEMAVVTKSLNNSRPSELIANYNAHRFVKPYEKRLRQPSPSIETPKKFSEKGSTSKSLGQSPNLFEPSTENNMVINSTDEPIKNTDKAVRLPSPIMEHSMNLNETDATMKTHLYSPQTQYENNKLQYYARNKAEIPHQLAPPVIEQPQNTTTFAPRKTHLYSPQTQSGTTSNKLQYYARNKAEIPHQLASPIIEQPQNTKTDALLETNYNKKPQNHAAEIESITNADGAVKNGEKTKCCSCSKTVEIGCGVILRECIHSFCMPCISSHIKQNLKYSGIRCPYSEEYECEFDLLDAEIRDIGGDLIYNKILDNRLKEYVGNDPNARVCLNENCKHIWFSKCIYRGTNERCPECKMNLYDSAHDSGKPHGFKSKVTKEKPYYKPKEEAIANNRKKCQEVVSGQIKSGEKCVKCSNRALVKLSICGQWFCRKCIQDSIKEQGLDGEKKSITCVTCMAPISESDIESLVNKKIFAKVKSKIVAAKLDPKQVDQPLNNGSKVSAERVKCEKTIEEPLIRKTFSNVADHQMKFDDFEKCIDCNNRADVKLLLCQHWYCNKCIQTLIKNQAFDHKKMSINCTACGGPISDSDIFQYGEKSIFDLYTSKVEAAKLVPELVDQPLESGSKVSVECLKYEKTFAEPEIRKQISDTVDRQMKFDVFKKCENCNNRGSVQLSICKHWFCNKCIQSSIKNQTFDPNQISINCTVCKDPISDAEVLRYGEKSIFDLYKSKVETAKLAPKPVEPLEDGNKELIECLKCEEKFEERLIHKCLKCVSSICLNCAKLTISGQMANNCPLKCLFCQTLLDKSQIDAIKKATFNETLQEKISYKEMVRPQPPVEIGFECLVCKKSADRDSQIVLANCKHRVCQKCLREKIEGETMWSKRPKCPICRELIDQMQLKIIGVDAFQNSGRNEDPKDICGICQQYLELNGGVTKALLYCEHRFCFQCISKALNDQSFVKRVPSCPTCAQEVSSTDIINLCGNEGFKRYMANKRKK